MNFVYHFEAKPQNGPVFSGKVMASSMELAQSKLSQQGLRVIEMRMNASDSLDLIVRKTANGREMAQFYKTMGRRLGNGSGLEQSLEESMEFTLDSVLSVIISMMLVAAKNGANIDTCMQYAGIDKRDVAVIRALREAGDAPRGLGDLASEYQQTYSLKRKLRSVFLEPLSILSFSYVLIWGVFVFAVPRIQHFYAQLPNASLPGYVKSLYAFVDMFDAHIVVSTVLYLLIVPLLILIIRSPLWTTVRDNIPSFRALSERSDHAMIWASYALLYEAAINRAEAAELISKSAKRMDSRAALANMAIAMRRGREPARAVAVAGFPRFVQGAVANYLRSGSADDVVEGLRLFSQNLAEDVDLLSERITTLARNAMYILMGVIIFFVAMITAVPMIETALHQV
ncbi:type II secretion system F family protein [Acidithiobacillus sp.]|nr:type II secretion system F family protein [Acidithiobacillus sp.]MDD2750013.1 type II secretion system F family protein [Acidithiobacillus sp.]MDD5278655.1 type II secretion system F family protein [Acidithiobacillus sp.]